MDKIMGVYKLQSKCKPERIYVGSSIDVKSRVSAHLGNMLHGYSNIRMIEHFIEFGRDDFEFTILEECSYDQLRIREQYYIDLYRPYFNKLNVDCSPLHTDSDLGGQWKEVQWPEILSYHEKLLEIRKREHKKHLAKYQNC